MTTDFYNLLLSDCALAAVLLALFFYVGRISRGVRGIAHEPAHGGGVRTKQLAQIALDGLAAPAGPTHTATACA